MSDHLEMSGESSLDKNFQIRTNNEGQNELYIPCWEEEGSNSTQYHHLIEETKFFKNKCKHLENHLEQNHRQFSSLNQLYLIAETNERRLLKQNEDLRKTNRELIGELSSTKVTIDTVSAELHAASKRESDFRQKYFKSRDRQTELLSEVDNLRSQCEMLKRKSATQGHSGAEDEKWKRYHNEQANQIQQWKAAFEALEIQFDKKSKEIREKNQQIKSLNKTFNVQKEDYELKINGLQADIEEMRRQLLKSKATINDYQRQIKEIRLVRDQVSAKNDQIQAQNNRLKRLLKDQASKYQKLYTEHQQAQQKNEELKDKNSGLTNDLSNLKNNISQLKVRFTNQEKQLNEARTQKEKTIVSKNQTENAYANLQQQLSQYKIQKENQISNLKSFYEGKIKQLKESSMDQKSILQVSISTLQKEIESLKSQRRENLKLEASVSKINQLEEENAALKEQVLNWRTKFDRLNSKYREQLLSFPKEQYQTEMNDLKLELASWKGKFDKLNIRYQEQLSSSKDVQQCRNDDDEINQLKDELKKTIDQNEQLKINSIKSGKLIQNLNVQLDNLRNKNETLLQQIQKNERINKLYQEERERLIKERNKLSLDINHLQEEMLKNQTQIESKAYQIKLKQQNRQIERLIKTNEELEHQIQTYRSRSKQEAKDAEKAERDKNKKYEIKLRQKERQISELELKIEQIENQHEKQRVKYKTIQKQNRIKDNQLNKKELKLKDLEKNVAELMIQIDQLDVANQRNKIQIETLKKQLKIQQTNNQKLKIQIQLHTSQKNSWESQQQVSNRQRLHEKQRHQWQEQQKKFIREIKSKEEEIFQLKKQIQLTQKGKELLISQASNLDAEKQKTFKQKIAELERLLKEKQSLLKRYQSVQRKDDDIPTGTLEELQAEYNRQLLALKRLIMYKGYKEDQNKRLQQLKTEYQSKIQIIMTDYKAMYQQMMILKEKLLNQKVVAAPGPCIDVAAIQEIWRIKVQQISQERQVLIQKVAMWQRKYEQLQFLFEAKLDSKQETINLLNLKLSNLEIARPLCQYSCHHR